MTAETPALLLIGHGSRSAAGIAEYWEFAEVLRTEAAEVDVGGGFIELAPPDLDTAIDTLVGGGAGHVVGVPLVLLEAGHLKNDGPAALARARLRHPGVTFQYARGLGIHPRILTLAEDRAHAALNSREPAETAVVLVSRGSSDPDANSDLYKIAHLIQDSRGFGMVEAAFVSLASPSVPEALERCRRLGATRIAVVPYFLFTGILVDRIHAQARAWANEQPGVEVLHGKHLGPHPEIARLVLERYRESLHGDIRMNCDCCVYRIALPGYEQRVGTPIPVDHEHDHAHGNSHEHSHQH